MERAGLLGRTKVMAAMLLLDAFSVSELAEQASVAYGTVVGVIGTMPDDSMELVPTPQDQPLRCQLTQDAFFSVQAELAALTDAPELLPFWQGAEIPLLLSVAKARLLTLEADSSRNTAMEHQRIASNLDMVEKHLLREPPPGWETQPFEDALGGVTPGPPADWVSRHLMDLDVARLVLDHHIRLLVLS